MLTTWLNEPWWRLASFNAARHATKSTRDGQPQTHNNSPRLTACWVRDLTAINVDLCPLNVLHCCPNVLWVTALLYLKVIEWVHLHDWPNGVDRQRDVDTLAGHQWSVNGQRTGGDHPETTCRKQTNKNHWWPSDANFWDTPSSDKSLIQQLYCCFKVTVIILQLNTAFPVSQSLTCSCWTGQRSQSCVAGPCWWRSCPCTCGPGGERRCQRSPVPWLSLQEATPGKKYQCNQFYI